jgi:hypothetical protein
MKHNRRLGWMAFVAVIVLAAASSVRAEARLYPGLPATPAPGFRGSDETFGLDPHQAMTEPDWAGLSNPIPAYQLHGVVWRPKIIRAPGMPVFPGVVQPRPASVQSDPVVFRTRFSQPWIPVGAYGQAYKPRLSPQVPRPRVLVPAVPHVAPLEAQRSFVLR